MLTGGIPEAEIEAGLVATLFGSGRRQADTVGCVALDARAMNEA